MSSHERYKGQMYNMEPNLLNRTVAEQIDDYQMRIYGLMKQAHPQMTGYTADCHECLAEEGGLDIRTRFFMHRPEEEKCES